MVDSDFLALFLHAGSHTLGTDLTKNVQDLTNVN